MRRKIVLVGDKTLNGGQVLPYQGPEWTFMGHRIALIGGRVYCSMCNSVGLVAKAGGSYRSLFYGGEQALEGDVVICHCPTPSPLVAILQSTSWVDDRDGFPDLVYEPMHAVGSSWYGANPQALMSSKKIVDEVVVHPREATDHEGICPNMSDEQIRELALEARDHAVHLIRLRLNDLMRWKNEDQAMVKLWFGSKDSETRDFLMRGLETCLSILQRFTKTNFVRYSEQLVQDLGCRPNGEREDVAAVCRLDKRTHTILLKQKFCFLRPNSGRFDSVVSTIIHEAAHYDESFGAQDIFYGFDKSLTLAALDPAKARVNCDNIAGYVVWETSFNS